MPIKNSFSRQTHDGPKSPPVLLNVSARVNDNSAVGTTVVDTSRYPNENGEGKTQEPDVKNENVITMMVNAKTAEIARLESKGKIEVVEDEQSCMYTEYPGTSIGYKECSTLSNMSIPNPLVDRLFALQPPPRLLSNRR